MSVLVPWVALQEMFLRMCVASFGIWRNKGAKNLFYPAHGAILLQTKTQQYHLQLLGLSE